MVGLLKLWLQSWQSVQTEALAAAQLAGNAGTSVGSKAFAFLNSVASSSTMGVAMLSVTVTTVVSTASVVYDVVLDPESNIQAQQNVFDSGVIKDENGNFISAGDLTFEYGINSDDSMSLLDLMSAVHDPDEAHTIYQPWEPDAQLMLESGLWTEDELMSMFETGETDEPDEPDTNIGLETISTQNNNSNNNETVPDDDGDSGSGSAETAIEAEQMSTALPPPPVTYSPPVLTLTPPTVTITRQPAATLTVYEGSIAGGLVVNAEITGITSLTYQWYQNTSASNTGGTAIPGATGQALFLPTNLTYGTYYYYVVVSAVNSGGSASIASNVSVVTVAPPVAPLHNLTVIGGGTGATPSGMRAQGSTVELNPGLQFGYRFTGWIVTSGNVSLTQLPPVPGYPTARFTMPASNVTVMATWIEIIPAITISTQPISQNTHVEAGGLLAVTATVNTGYPLSYQWYFNTTNSNTGGTPIAGATDNIAIVGPYTTPGEYFYYVEISSYGIPTKTSEVAVITVRSVHTVTVVSAGTVNAYALREGAPWNTATVNGTFAHGDKIEISPGQHIAGHKFIRWDASPNLDITLINSNTGLATFTMPASNVNLTAIWEEASDDDKFTITVVSEASDAYARNFATNSDGPFLKDDLIMIHAGTRTGYAFAGWIVTAGDAPGLNLSESPQLWEMPANDVTIEATWVKTYTVTVISNGAFLEYASKPGVPDFGPFLPDDTIEIFAGIHVGGLIFDGWTVTSGGASLDDENAATTTFTMPANNVVVTANWVPDTVERFTVTVISEGALLEYAAKPGTADFGPFLPDDIVEISAGLRFDGLIFNGWTVTSGGASLDDENAATTTFTMPANNVVVTANWGLPSSPEQYTVTMAGGGNGSFGAGQNPQGATVVIFAGTSMPPGLIFGGWTVTTILPGLPFPTPVNVNMDDANSPIASFTMPPFDVTVTANWLPPFSMPLSLTLDTPADEPPPTGEPTEPPTGEPTDATEPPNGNPPVDDSTEPPEPETGEPPTGDSTEPPEPETGETPEQEATNPPEESSDPPAEEPQD